MSDCNCGYDMGHPQVTKHADHCTSRKIATLQARVKELEAALRPLIEGYGYISWTDDSERLEDPDIKMALAALLEVGDE